MLGGGPIGLSVIQALKARGCEKIIVSEVSSMRKQYASDFGAHHILDPAKDDIVAKCRELCDGKGAHMVFDCAGVQSALNQAVKAIRARGTIVNIAADMCQQRVCSPADLETAVRLGLGYPRGPLALGDLYGPTNMLEVLFNLQTVYGDPRYRPSPWLRRRGALGLSLMHEEN